MIAREAGYAIFGPLRKEYIITHAGRVYLGILGGRAAYAAYAARVWSDSVAIVSRVGSNFPQHWLNTLQKHGINVEAVHRLAEPHEACAFYAYNSLEDRSISKPATHFTKLGHALPKDLVDYSSPDNFGKVQDGFGPLTLRPDDFPVRASFIKGIHITAAEYASQTTLAVRARDLGIPLVTLDASMLYMEPSLENELALVINGVDVFLVSETEANAYFRPLTPDIWQMAETFGAMGCRYVVIKRGARGQCVFDRERDRRWLVPAYPVEVQEITGAGDAYCGGFLVGMGEAGDVLEAALRGSISASLAIEGVGAASILDALPGLAQARLESLRSSVKVV